MSFVQIAATLVKGYTAVTQNKIENKQLALQQQQGTLGAQENMIISQQNEAGAADAARATAIQNAATEFNQAAITASGTNQASSKNMGIVVVGGAAVLFLVFYIASKQQQTTQ